MPVQTPPRNTTALQARPDTRKGRPAVKTTQYMKAEKAIVTAEAGGIRSRWLYGLRLLRDTEAMSPGGGGLRHGVADQLIAAAKQRDFKLSATEIRYRIQCARTYPTESQIANAVGDFTTWHDLIQAGFPAYPATEDEPLADHRTEEERRRDRAKVLLDLIGEQGSLFPLDQFEPTEATLKELLDYADQQEALTARFVERGRVRREYLDELVAAAEDDLDCTWQDAHVLAYGDDGPADGERDDPS